LQSGPKAAEIEQIGAAAMATLRIATLKTLAASVDASPKSDRRDSDRSILVECLANLPLAATSADFDRQNCDLIATNLAKLMSPRNWTL
jgi:hypothetical protein